MNLLVITQKVDKQDAVLGFFHNWLNALSEKFESIVVICLEKGDVALPANVKVLSLGKEKRANDFQYVWRFYKYIWQERKNYDAVFVHMNQEYVILGWKIWYLLRKKIYLWRNHKKGNFMTKIAVFFSHKVFCTSKDSYTAQFKKTVIMPVGIDTETFKPATNGEKINKIKKILFIGRIAPVKRVELFIETLGLLFKEGVDFTADVYGNALESNKSYFEKVRSRAIELNLGSLVTFHAEVPNYKTPEIYNSHGIYVNLTPSGSFDKAILEAAACGCIPVITNKTLEGEFPDELLMGETAHEIASNIKEVLSFPESTLKELSGKVEDYVVKKHSLRALAEKLFSEINQTKISK